MGFADPARAEPLLLAGLGMSAADPDLALAGLARLFGATTGKDALRAALRAAQDCRDRLTAVLGVSAGLADHLARHPEDAEILRGAITRPEAAELRAGLLRAVGADPADPDSAGPDSGGPDSADPDSADPDSADPDGPVAAGREPTAALAAAY